LAEKKRFSTLTPELTFQPKEPLSSSPEYVRRRGEAGGWVKVLNPDVTVFPLIVHSTVGAGLALLARQR
jgi:hypothetical protein